ncbi:MAG TPA: phosphoenolpyruvate synthase, partial [Methanophagales archaeon]|nr:phosphoenolpyruvate synthase [Methanophagales archaeon]
MKFIKWFEEVGTGDVALVGGKNASLGEMIRNLSEKGVAVPSGFAITAEAYRYLLQERGIQEKIRDTLVDLDTHDMENLSKRGSHIRALIKNAGCPKELEEEIRTAYRKMEERYGAGADVAVRSSATAEDLPTASFAGQQETYLNVRGEEELVEKVMECFASLYTNRAISYRVDKGFDHLSVYLSVGIQKMVRSDLACSGVTFSIDTESGFRDAVYITGAYGLGENVVQGTVNPDQFYVFKPTLKEGFRPIVEKKLGTKRKKLVYKEKGTGTKQKKVEKAQQREFVLTDDEVLTFARWACIIEDHYGTPVDIEWAKDGRTNELFVVQARPETVHSQKDVAVTETYVLEEDRELLKAQGRLLVEGEAVGSKIGYGEVIAIENTRDIHEFKPGQVLVTNMTDPDWEPIMKVAGAIITNRGGRTCHAAIISRELGIPCVVGTVKGTRALKGVKDVTIDCSEGIGRIYEGKLKYRIEKLTLDKLPRPRTRIMMNAGVPENAFVHGQIPNDGVGLAREEFIINSYIGIHPQALIEYDELKKRATEEGDRKIARVVKEIDERSASYEDKVEFFVDNLARGIGKIAAGFYPN